MPTLHVRNVPDALHKRIQGLASIESVSITAEVIHLLEVAVEHSELVRKQDTVLKQIRRNRIRPATGKKSSLALLWEDRDR